MSFTITPPPVTQQELDAKTGITIQDTSDDTIASAATLDLDSVPGPQVEVTGTTDITAIDLTKGEFRVVVFDDILDITPDANLLTPGGAVITTEDGGWGVVIGEAGGVVRIESYQTAEGYKKDTLGNIFMNPGANIRGVLPGDHFDIGYNEGDIIGNFLRVALGTSIQVRKNDGTGGITLNSNFLTDFWDQILPDKSGTFAILDDVEPPLGNPGTNGFVLSSTTAGVRSWVDKAPGAGTVTLAMMANMATASLIYRKTAGTGVPEVNSLATLKTDLGLTGTNTGDQTITLTGHVTGTGTGSFATTIAAGVVSMAMHADQAGLSVIGRSANTTGVPAAITGTDGQVLRVSGTTLGFGTIVAAGLASDAVTTVKILDANVTLAKMANLATSTLIGRVTGSTGVPEAITVGTGILTFLQTPTTANFAAAVTGETGTGNVVFSASPTFTGVISGADLSLSSSSNPMVQFSCTTASTYLGAFTLLAPNMTASQMIYFMMGKASGATNNSAYIGFVYKGGVANDPLNRLAFSWWGTDCAHNFYVSGGYYAGVQALNAPVDPGSGCIQAAGKIIAGAQIRLKGYTVATLPAGTVGDTAYATDLLTPTFLVAAVGGGAVVGPCFYNGTAWVTF